MEDNPHHYNDEIGKSVLIDGREDLCIWLEKRCPCCQRTGHAGDLHAAETLRLADVYKKADAMAQQARDQKEFDAASIDATRAQHALLRHVRGS